LPRQYLERNDAVKFGVAGAVYLPHPAFPHERNDLVMADGLVRGRRRFVFHDQRSSHGVGRGFNETFGLPIGGKQRLDLAAQRVVNAASLADERSPLFGRAFERRLEQLIHLSPSLRLHHFSRLSTSGAARPWPRAIRAAQSAKKCPSPPPSLPRST